jgi:uncharacterized protein YbjT (DUF2867 family)
MTRHVLVLGATGFTGRRVTRALVRDGHDVVAFVRASSDPLVAASTGARVVVGDLDREETLETALRGRDALVCCASLGFGHAPKIVAVTTKCGIRRSVFFGTTAVRTRLDVPTKAVRLEAERLVLGAPLGATLLRPTMIYGAPGDRNVERLLRLVARWPVIVVPGSGRGLQQPVHVDDVAEAAATVLPRDDLAGRTFDLPGPVPLTLDEVIRTVARVLGKKRLLLHVPIALVRAVAWTVGVRAEQLARLEEDKSADPASARAAFEFRSRAFESGLASEAKLIEAAP